MEKDRLQTARERAIPVSLSVVSYLFLLMGIISGFDTLGEATRGSFSFHFGILGIGIFFGLRRYSLGWRTCALVFIWVGLITLAYVFFYGAFGTGPAFIKIFGRRYADIPVFWVSIVAAIVFPLEFWMFRVLTRPNIRDMFYEKW